MSPFQIKNIRYFIAFRAFFNARFYYPVFSILFLDFGLTLSQFAVLNAVWAATIVLCEVPSGALADTIGRRNLLVFAGAAMGVEMVLWASAPRENPSILFFFLLANRILSGVAEASASGADEALAYDTLKRHGDIRDWARVLECQMRIQAIGFVVVMIVGGAVYDPAFVQAVVDLAGMPLAVTRETTLRLPVFLTLAMAGATLMTAVKMEEVADPACRNVDGCVHSVSTAFSKTLDTGRWILKTPFVLIVICTGLVFDSVVRMVITMGSQYYRLIQIPEALFGFIGSAVSLLGLVVPRLARRLTTQHTPGFNMGVMTLLTFTGLIGMTFFLPYAGLIPALILFSNLFLLNFFLSTYLNRAADSSRRATVLSFKGLALNLGYGLIGVLYSLLLAFIRSKKAALQPDLAGDALKNAVFVDAMVWFPCYLGVGVAALLILNVWKCRRPEEKGARCIFPGGE